MTRKWPRRHIWIAAGLGNGALDGGTDDFGLHRSRMTGRIDRKWFDGIMLDTVATRAFAQLQHLDGFGTDINPDQRR